MELVDFHPPLSMCLCFCSNKKIARELHLSRPLNLFPPRPPPPSRLFASLSRPLPSKCRPTV